MASINCKVCNWDGSHERPIRHCDRCNRFFCSKCISNHTCELVRELTFFEKLTDSLTSFFKTSQPETTAPAKSPEVTVEKPSNPETPTPERTDHCTYCNKKIKGNQIKHCNFCSKNLCSTHFGVAQHNCPRRISTSSSFSEFESEKKVKASKEFVPACARCKRVLSTFEDEFYCDDCGKFYCSVHQSHESKHRVDLTVKRPKKAKPSTRKQDEVLIIGQCKVCGKDLNVFNTRCRFCVALLCTDHMPQSNHDCNPIKTVGNADPSKKGDTVLTLANIESIRKAVDKLNEYSRNHMEVSGLITPDGKIEHVNIGTPDSVEVLVDSNWQKPGIIFHTHPIDYIEPSSADYRHAKMYLKINKKAKFIVVGKLGFTSYYPGYPAIMYGWFEI